MSGQSLTCVSGRLWCFVEGVDVILVTGGAGFIGSHTCVELLQAGHDVTVYDNFCNSHRESLARVERITGKTVRIKGKGMPHLNGRQRGDLVVELFVETPTDLTPRQKELMQELAASFGESQNPRNSSFAGKAKRFWADILGGDADNPKETA